MVNKKLFVSLAIFIVIIGLAGTGTFAYFTSSTTSIGNTINSGTFTLDTGGSVTTPFTVSNAIPMSVDSNTIPIPSTVPLSDGATFDIKSSASNTAHSTLYVSIINPSSPVDDLTRNVGIYAEGLSAPKPAVYA